MKRLLTLLWLTCLLLPLAAKDFNVLNYGADLSGESITSEAINRAISACHEQGGGRVVLPRGRYLCGTLVMKSGVELRLEQGAVVCASKAYDDFPLQPRNPYRSQKDTYGWKALIYAADCHDIAITGEGTIEGNGGERKTGLDRVPKD
jgi:polygalacturonase